MGTMRTVVAMSGGVDSTVAAALLADAGHEVIGLSMQLYDQRGGEATFGSCCTIDDLHDARRAAQQIGIPHYIVNFEAPFREHVIANFVSEYLAGRTPIPCTHCNSDVKFATLLERSAGLGADHLATGHYVRVDYDEARARYVLRRGLDTSKDQAYFLFSLTQDQLSHALFPVGAMTKDAVRAFARERGLLTADKPDSHEICFVPDGDYAAFVAREAGSAARPGVIRDGAGHVLATHDGVHHFTIGQRKGLRLSTGVPLYVNAIDADERDGHRGPARVDRAAHVPRARCELDVGRGARDAAAGDGADPPSARRLGRDGDAGRRGRAGDVRRTAVGHHPGPGGRVLRRRRGPRRRVDCRAA